MLRDNETLQRLMKCTYTDSSGTKCGIFSELDALNAELCKVDLVLQENAPGLLVLTTINIGGRPRLRIYHENPFQWHRLKLILLWHDCIASVDVGAVNIRERHSTSLACVLLDKLPSLRALRAYDVFATEEQMCSVTYMLSTAYALKMLYLQSKAALNPTCTGNLQHLFQNTERLTNLSITKLHLHFPAATQLFRGLLVNKSIQTLKISACSCFYGPEHGNPLIAALIRTLTLRSLTLERCCLECKSAVSDIMTAVAHNRCLSELSLTGFCFRVAFDVLMPTVLINNDALRHLSIECCEIDNREPCRCESGLAHCTDDCSLGYLSRESMNLDLLTEAISGNEDLEEDLGLEEDVGVEEDVGLEELRVDLYTTPLSMCQRFFEALRENTTLRRVTVLRFPNKQAAALCQAIRHSGVQERVNISRPYIFEEPLDLSAECTSFSSVILHCNYLPNMRLFYGALTLLPRWNHVRDLSVRLLSDQLCSMYKHLLFYLQTATNLRSLFLDVTGRVVRDIRRKLLMVLLSCCRNATTEDCWRPGIGPL
ncbi:hypothetical protein MTO96_044328 [Rhipicephalus appendiculatus]